MIVEMLKKEMRTYFTTDEVPIVLQHRAALESLVRQYLLTWEKEALVSSLNIGGSIGEEMRIRLRTLDNLADGFSAWIERMLQ